jgi:hypothetical protein
MSAMDEVTTGRHGHSKPGWVPWAVSLLLIGAAISLAVTLLPEWYQLFGPYLIVDADLVVDAFGSITLFVLPAAVLVGSGRWAAGRQWLWWGAAALSFLAVTSLVREAWFAAFAVWPDVVSLDWQGAWTALWLGGAATMVIANVMLAAGLWRAVSGSMAPATQPVIRAASVLVALLSLVVVLASAATAFVIPWNGIETAVLATAGGLLLAAGYGALGLVAIAALRALPASGALPELLIAVGATVAMLGGAAIWVVPYFVRGEMPDIITVIFSMLAGLSVAGLLVMAAGFALGVRVDVTGEAAVSSV